MTTLLLGLQRELALTGLAEDNRKAQNFVDAVKTILAEQSNLVRGGTASNKGKAKDDSARALEIQYAYERYLQEFGSGHDCMDEEIGDEHFATGRDLVMHHDSCIATEFNCDLGVEDESQKSWESLMTCLGLSGRSTLPFMNTARHTEPYLIWTAPLTSTEVSHQIRQANEPGRSVMHWKPLSLRWHQLAGISAIVRLFSEPAQGGVLISDEVGLGKTSQTLGIMALFIHRADTSQRNINISGRMSDLPVSTGPHVIVAPPSLIDNWRVEAMMWLNICVEVFVYTGSESARGKIFAPGSAWDSSKSPLFRRIILVNSAVKKLCSSTVIGFSDIYLYRH